MVSEKQVWPAQCRCGHVYIERYKFPQPTNEGNIGFCWCGWCRTKRMVKEEGDDSGWGQKKTAGTIALVALIGFVLLWIFGVLPTG